MNADSCGVKSVEICVSVMVYWPLVSSDMSTGKIAWNYGHSCSVAAIGRLWFSFLFLVIAVSVLLIWCLYSGVRWKQGLHAVLVELVIHPLSLYTERNFSVVWEFSLGTKHCELSRVMMAK